MSHDDVCKHQIFYIYVIFDRFTSAVVRVIESKDVCVRVAVKKSSRVLMSAAFNTFNLHLTNCLRCWQQLADNYPCAGQYGGLQVGYLVVSLQFSGTDVKSHPPSSLLLLPAGILITVGRAAGFVGQQRRLPDCQQPVLRWMPPPPQVHPNLTSLGLNNLLLHSEKVLTESRRSQ